MQPVEPTTLETQGTVTKRSATRQRMSHHRFRRRRFETESTTATNLAVSVFIGVSFLFAHRIRNPYPGFPFWPSRSAPLYTKRLPRGPDVFVANASGSDTVSGAHIAVARAGSDRMPGHFLDTSPVLRPLVASRAPVSWPPVLWCADVLAPARRPAPADRVSCGTAAGAAGGDQIHGGRSRDAGVPQAHVAPGEARRKSHRRLSRPSGPASRPRSAGSSTTRRSFPPAPLPASSARARTGRRRSPSPRARRRGSPFRRTAGPRPRPHRA